MAKGPSKAREARTTIEIGEGLRGGMEPELPFRMLVMGDYTQKDDGRTMEDRTPVDVNKSNFDSVMQSFNLALETTLHDRISGSGKIPVSLKFGTLKDFRPESIARHVPQLKDLLEMRDGLKALRPVMDKRNIEILTRAIKDPETREKILAKITTPEGEGGGGDAAAKSGEGESEGEGGEGEPKKS